MFRLVLVLIEIQFWLMTFVFSSKYSSLCVWFIKWVLKFWTNSCMWLDTHVVWNEQLSTKDRFLLVLPGSLKKVLIAICWKYLQLNTKSERITEVEVCIKCICSSKCPPHEWSDWWNLTFGYKFHAKTFFPALLWILWSQCKRSSLKLDPVWIYIQCICRDRLWLGSVWVRASL